MTGRLLLEHSLDAVLLTAPGGRILSANAAACRMFGRSEEAICSLGRAGIMDTADPRLAAAIEERERTGRFVGELTGLRADGTPFPVELSTAVFTDSAGQSLTSMVIRDITHRKAREEELRLTRERLEVALAGADLGAYDIDRTTRQAVVDRRYLEMLGYEPGEVVITRELLQSWMHPDDVAEVDRAYGAHLRGETPAFDIEYRVRHRDGHWLWIRDRGRVTARDPDGTPRRVVGTHLDVTQQRRAELGLRASEARYRSLLEGAGIGMAAFDGAGRLLELNTAALRITGGAAEAHIGRTPQEVFGEQAGSTVAARLESAMRSSAGQSYETLFTFPNGATRWLLSNYSRVTAPGGEVAGVQVISVDVTEHRRGDVELRDALAWQQAIFEGSRDAVFISDERARFTAVNSAAERLTGYSREELLAMSIPDLHDAADLRAFETFHARILAGEEVLSEAPVRRRDGTKVDIEFSNSSIEIGGSRYMHTAARDLTERRRATKAIGERDRVMRYIVEHDPNAIAVYDRDLRYIAVSRRYLQDYGIKDTDIIGRHHYEVFPEMPERWKAVHRRVLAGAIEKDDDDSFERPDGSVTYNRWECRPWFDADGTIGGMITYTEVTTERKVAELALRASEERYRALVELSPDAIMIHVGGRLVFANEGAARLLGAGSSERLIGLPVMDLVHPDYREIVRDRVRTATDGGRSAPLIEERFLRLDGSEVEVEVTASPFTYLGERGVQVVAREIGERKRVERERELLLERVRGLAIRLTHADEAQRTRLARDLHDSVGQNLSALGLTLSIARSQLSPSALAAVGPRLDDAEALLGASVRQVRDVMAELRPPALDELGLAAALHSYGEQLERRTGTIVAVVGCEPDPRLPAKAEIAVFRIVQEALTNVAKYAGARHVEVRIDQREGAVAVLVEDDGVGFDMGARSGGRAGSGWGLMGMRERAEGIGATVSVASSPGRGTRVIVTLPR